MRRPIKPSPIAGTRNRFGQSRLAKGDITPANSNTRILGALQVPDVPAIRELSSCVNMGLNSERLRVRMVARLRDQGISDDKILDAIQAVPRHIFVDQGLASRAYEDAALPIGYGQTISQPWVVARMISAVCESAMPTKVLEVGGGCGYQAAVLAQLVDRVYVIERIRGLYEQARDHLQALRLSHRIRLVHGDGQLGLPDAAPFDAIIVAAAGAHLPQPLLEQLAIGGRLIAPYGQSVQRLTLVERTGPTRWQRKQLETVRFVPLRAGIQL